MRRYLAFPVVAVILALLAAAVPCSAQSYLDSGTYGMKVYFTNSTFYPYVMSYFRTMDTNQEPLVNLTPLNVGLMVQGKVYDPYKKQYGIQTLKDRTEGFRTVLVIDASASLAGQPFRDLLDACRTYIKLKTPSDEIAIIALSNEVKIVSPFTKDANKLELLLNDLQANGKRTPLWDGIGRAIQMSASAVGSSFGDSPDFIVLSNIVVLTDGFDQGSSMTKDNLMGKILDMKPPFPIYGIGYLTPAPQPGLNDLKALTEASFGRYWHLDSTGDFARVLNKIQEINRHDYVLTFRSYLPVDGMKHNLKVLLNYEGRAQAATADFETMEVPMINDNFRRIRMALESKIPPLPDANPYFGGPVPGVQRMGVTPPPIPQ